MNESEGRNLVGDNLPSTGPEKGSQYVFNLGIRSAVDQMEPIEGVFRDGLKKFGWSEEERRLLCKGFQLVLEDAIIFGNQQDKRKKVGVHWLMGETELLLQIQDEGAPYNPEPLPAQSVIHRLLHPRRRSTADLMEFFDDVHFSHQGKGMLVRLYKKNPRLSSPSQV